MKASEKLRGYIPLGAPLNWEPVITEETEQRTIVSFTTKWFNQRVGIDFSEAFHTDPNERFRSLLKMKRYIRETFPQIPCFAEHDAEGFEQECATISGVFGVCFVAMVYGLDVIYDNNNWPAIDPGSQLSADEIKKLKPLNLQNNPAVEQLFRQMDVIEKNWGVVDGYLNYQGVLNNAFKIRGSDILYDLIDDPGFAHHLFAHITDTMERLILLIQKRQRESGFFIDSFCVSNCVVNLISPKTYAEFILPYDRKLSESFPSFGVHSCNWVVDPYLDTFRQIGELAYLDFGFDSNLAEIRDALPSATKNVFYDPAFLTQKAESEIAADIRRIRRNLGSCEITLPDIDIFTPDSKIIRFAELTHEIDKSHFDGE